MMLIRDMRSDEIELVSDLALRSFSTFIAPGLTQEGQTEILHFANAENLAERHAAGHFTLVAEIDTVLAGMIQVRCPSHVLMLYVDEQFHRRGIAQHLMQSAVERIRLEFPEVELVTVNSSTYAVTAYRRMGFEAISEELCTGGVVYTPMVLRLHPIKITG
ncbi:MAG: GNAT family N-acetyltransferase [Acidobacteria bacterium]|nr:GNAT family N-acetyltransferase [Acidobacteriota bacterium]